MIKNIISAAAALAMGTFLLTGCGADQTTNKSSDKLSVVCTIFPEYDWTKQIIGSNSDNVQLTYLLSNGSDLHNYQPTADDMIRISDCDVFVYVGGESDKWVDEALGEARNKDMQVIDLMDVLDGSTKAEELKEGMEPEEEAEEEDDEEEIEYDEHVWLSLKNAEVCVSAIADALAKADPANADVYKSNSEAYIAELDALDGRFRTMLDSAAEKTLIFGDRFPFRYFVDDYGLDYYAAFAGCSAETEASFETIAFLAQKADQLGSSTIFTIEGSECSIAEAVVNSTRDKNQTIAVLDSVQSVNTDRISSGVTYLSIMEQNYDVLKEALN